jgi:hypothetical protein
MAFCRRPSSSNILHAKGLATGEIQSQLDEIYGAELQGHDQPDHRQWSRRARSSGRAVRSTALYPVLFIDAIKVTIR